MEQRGFGRPLGAGLSTGHTTSAQRLSGTPETPQFWCLRVPIRSLQNGISLTCTAAVHPRRSESEVLVLIVFSCRFNCALVRSATLEAVVT